MVRIHLPPAASQPRTSRDRGIRRAGGGEISSMLTDQSCSYQLASVRPWGCDDHAIILDRYAVRCRIRLQGLSPPRPPPGARPSPAATESLKAPPPPGLRSEDKTLRPWRSLLQETTSAAAAPDRPRPPAVKASPNAPISCWRCLDSRLAISSSRSPAIGRSSYFLTMPLIAPSKPL
jgi:hypothetical protein